MPWLKKIISLIGVLRSTVFGDRRFAEMPTSGDLKSGDPVSIAWVSKNNSWKLQAHGLVHINICYVIFTQRQSTVFSALSLQTKKLLNGKRGTVFASSLNNFGLLSRNNCFLLTRSFCQSSCVLDISRFSAKTIFFISWLSNTCATIILGVTTCMEEITS